MGVTAADPASADASAAAPRNPTGLFRRRPVPRMVAPGPQRPGVLTAVGVISILWGLLSLIGIWPPSRHAGSLPADAVAGLGSGRHRRRRPPSHPMTATPSAPRASRPTTGGRSFPRRPSPGFRRTARRCWIASSPTRAPRRSRPAQARLPEARLAELAADTGAVRREVPGKRSWAVRVFRTDKGELAMRDARAIFTPADGGPRHVMDHNLYTDGGGRTWWSSAGLREAIRDWRTREGGGPLVPAGAAPLPIPNAVQVSTMFARLREAPHDAPPGGRVVGERAELLPVPAGLLRLGLATLQRRAGGRPRQARLLQIRVFAQAAHRAGRRERDRGRPRPARPPRLPPPARRPRTGRRGQGILDACTGGVLSAAALFLAGVRLLRGKTGAPATCGGRRPAWFACCCSCTPRG